MIRRAAAIVVALTLNQTLLIAQETVLTVSAASADVYRGPSTITPVIAHVPRGTVLPVVRNLGSWVRVPWPDSPDGVAYVHVTTGRIGPPSADTDQPSHASSTAAPGMRTTTSPPTTTIQTMGRTSVGEQVVPRGQLHLTPASHMFGVGGLVASTSTFGATARAWRTNHFGIQLGFTRDAMTSATAPGRVTSMQFEPAVVWGLLDRVSDYVWLRPYVGSTVSFAHQTLAVAAPVPVESASQNGIGFRVFGGTELMFASIPRFGLSADAGYRRLPTAFGFDATPFSVALAGHWYVK